MDNHHVNVTGSYASCGVAELHGITSDSEKVLYALATRLYHPSRGEPYAYVMWSDLPYSNGAKLAAFIDKPLFGAGELTEIGPVDNPKTGNEIFVWVWQVPHVEFKKWYVEQRVKNARKL